MNISQPANRERTRVFMQSRPGQNMSPDFHRSVSASRGKRSRSSACFVVFAVTLFATAVHAHYCGYPVVRCQPGDIVKYEIIADVSEDQVSLYDVFDQSNPFVAPVVFFTPVSAIRGLFIYEARLVGTNYTDLFWSFPPHAASGFCTFDIFVSTNWSAGTAGDRPFSAHHGDPVNMFTGELVVREAPDLSLGGPMPLFFARYYASGLQSDALVKSALGNNWSHNFDWSVIVLTNRAVVISPDGLNVHFDRTGGMWTLNHPTHLPYQLADSGTNVVFGDSADNLLYTFATNGNGLLLSISDGKGNQHTLTYTNDIQLAQVSDGLGRTLGFSYASAQLLRSVTDGTRTVGFSQVQSGPQFNLVRVTNALGRVTTYTYDNSNGDGSLLTSTILPMGNPFYSQVYDAAGRVIQQSRLGTNIHRFAYDTNTFKTYTTNALGNVTVFQHSADGHLLGVTDPASDTIALTTNSSGLRSTIANRTGGRVGLAYDPASRKPSAFTNANGGVTFFTYTNRTVNGIVLYDLSSVTSPDGTTERYTYDAVGNVIARQDQAGKITRFAYNSRGQWLGVTNPASAVVSFTYNADGTLATRSDAETGTSSVFYDALRRPTNAVASDGRSLRLGFDALNRVVSSTDERTNTTFFGYDANDRLIGATNALGQVVRFSYDSADRLTAVTDRSGKQTSYTYDGLDQMVNVTNRNGNRTAFSWDSRQRLSSVIDPGNQSWLLGYDDESLFTSATDPLGNVLRRALDAAGFVSAITNASGQAVTFQRDAMHRVSTSGDSLGRQHQFAYDARGTLTNTTLPTVGAAGYEPDDLGSLKTLTDQNGRQWRFGYSTLGRLLTLVDPLNRTNSVSYDASGRPRRFAFADGATLTNTFDGVGNITRRDFNSGPAVTYGYDPLNRLTNTSGLALAYDKEDRVTNTVSSGLNFGAAFDNDGRVTNVTYNGGALIVTYVYDSRDRLVQVSDNLTPAQVNFFYDNAGRLTNVVRANGVNGVYDYDAVGRLTRIREGGFLDLKYTLNNAGEVAFLDSTAPLSAAPAAGETNQLSFDNAHQISSSGYGYDARGRLTSSPGHTFAWDTASHLIRIDSVTNAYNGMGDLMTRSTGGGTIRFHYNHALGLTPIVAEQDAGSSQFLRYYIWSPEGELLYMIDATNSNAVSYYHFDRVGSALALTSGAGAVTDAYAYSVFGFVAARSGSNPQPFTYVGRYGVRAESAAGLYHMRARYFDPVSGRFLSPDPVWPRAEDPLSLNPYAYAANNPLQFIDPSGTRDLQSEMVVRIVMLAFAFNQLNSLGFDPLTYVQSAVPPSKRISSLSLNQFILLYVYLQSYYDPLYRHHQEELARYNQLTRLVKQHPGLAAVGLFGFARSYDPAVQFARAGVPLAPFVVQTGNLKIWAALQEDRESALAYARAVRQIPDSFVNAKAPGILKVIGLTTGFAPSELVPRGRVWVNGQLVQPKLEDLVYGAFELRRLYRSLDRDDIWPEDVLDNLLDRLLGTETEKY